MWLVNMKRISEWGFTVVEFVVAASILFVITVSVVGVIGFAADTTRSTVAREAATNLANERIEQARNVPYDEIGIVYPDGSYGDPAGTILSEETVGDYTVTTDVRWARSAAGRATYKQITVTVAWTEPRADSLSVSSNIYGKSELVNSGDVLIDVRDIDTNEPIPGARVTIQPSTGIARTLRTTSAGEAFFGFVPAGTMSTNITADGYIMDLSGVSGATVAVDLVTRLTVYGHRPSTGVVHVRTTAGVPITNASVTLVKPDGSTVGPQAVDANGDTSFSNLIRGTYSVRVTAPGRAMGTEPLIITMGNQTVEVTVRLADPAALSVLVRNDAGVNGIAGATVTVKGPSPATTNVTGSPATSPSSGECTFNLVTSGTYSITVSKSGFVTQTRSIPIVAGTPRTEQFNLTPVMAGSLKITVYDKEGHRDDYRDVRVYNATLTFDMTIKTDSNGVVVFSDMPEGAYTVKVKDATAKSTSVTAGTETLVTIYRK